MKDSPIKRLLLWSKKTGVRWKRYTKIVVGVSLGIWIPAISYIVLKTPTYKSEWTLILPGSGSGSQINIDRIGQASSQTTSAYASKDVSPKVSYKEISLSTHVLGLAAEHLDVSVKDFGKPKIKLIEQTNLIRYKATALSPEAAKSKADAHIAALKSFLDTLRKDEIERRDQGFGKLLETYKSNLENAKRALVDYQSKSQLISQNQFSDVVASREKLIWEKSQLLAEFARVEGEVEQLSLSLGISTQQAGMLVKLHSDLQYENTLIEVSKHRVALAKYEANLGGNHPQLLREKTRYAAALGKLKERATLLVGEQSYQHLPLSNRSDAPGVTLSEQLVTAYAKASGIKKQLAALQSLIADSDITIENFSRQAAKLEELERDHQIAQAVFASFLAKIDTGKSDIYASYPLIQVLEEPSFVVKPDSPNTLLALVFAILATIFSYIGLALLWIRIPILQRLLNAS